MKNLIIKKGTVLAPGLILLDDFDYNEYLVNDYTALCDDSRVTSTNNRGVSQFNCLTAGRVKTLYNKSYAVTKARLEIAGIFIDSFSTNKLGKKIARRGFFYTMGKTADDFENEI